MSARVGRLLTVATSVLLAIALALGVTWVVLGRGVSSKDSQANGRVQALAAARQVAVNINSYDYDKLAGQFARVQAELTGKALADFTQNKDNISKQLTANKEHASAQVLDAATISASSDEATELIALAISFTTPKGQAGPSTSYAQVHLVRNQGRWVVDIFQAVT
ncbi:MAG TPA: hypothetical protein VGN54_12200 [Mycobacteriales bacterium]|nr:hypothetical protein [Mycobacteriales bacterium]